MCSVVEHLVGWTLTTGGTDGGATCNGAQLNVMDPPGTNNNSENSAVNCSICLPVPAGTTPPSGC
jgi:hypothetical protein